METRAFAPLYSPSSGTGFGSLLPSTTITGSTSEAHNTVPFAGNPYNSMVQIQIANTTTAWAYVNFGELGHVVAATVAASYPVGPGAMIVISVGGDVNAASVILGAAPGTNTAVIFTRGEGL